LGYKNFYLYSAVNPENGNNFSLIMPNVDTNNFNVYLQYFSQYLQDNNPNHKVLLVMDGAGWHKSKNLIKFDNIEFIIQPSYSPELNPIEKLWQYIKRHTIKNKVFKTIKDIEKELCKFLKNMTIEDYKSVCHVKYI
jgi:transposase|tara:strand:+ start:728 stop:1138 length:411 start_codon:yes stop_codon:yes gene_type:complete